MKYVVAVSGGVDSVVLLDMLVKTGEHELVVAHFDHGIREESDADARFVKALAKKYHLPFEHRREELGQAASEELARERRYDFLRLLARQHDARIITAHHLDDVVETIVINIERGTGWRGLAVLNASDIERPLLRKTKQELYAYAIENSLEWVEDETNSLDAYHRNRVRKSTTRMADDTKHELANLRDKQVAVSHSVNDEVERLARQWGASRYPHCMIDAPEALEILRHVTDGRLTRPQQKALWLAIKTARPGTKHQSGNNVSAQFTLDEFHLRVV